MLVLTRRENEKIIFPDVDISVEVVSISGSRARLGVRAPSDIRILRQEIAEDSSQAARPKPRSQQGGNPLSHSVRNRLNAASIAAQLLRRQMEHALYSNADETARMLLEELGELNQELVNSAKKPEKPSTEGQRRRALLVEDNPNERQLLAGFLKMAGFEVDTAGDGEDALQYLESHDRPDVILMDMLMPRCDGPTAVNRIRTNPGLSGTKIFVVSGTAPSKFGLETGPAGIDKWFNKPIDPEQLAREMAADLMRNHQVA